MQVPSTITLNNGHSKYGPRANPYFLENRGIPMDIPEKLTGKIINIKIS